VNVPYYHTMETSHPTALGMRQTPRSDALRAVIEEVARRRALSLPNRPWQRITGPESSDVLCGNLARSAGGAAPDDAAVFRSPDDPDYRKVLAAWGLFLQELAEPPRMDMPGGRASVASCRTTH